MSEDDTNHPPAPPIFTPKPATEIDRANLPIPTTFDAVAWAEYAFELEKRLGIATTHPSGMDAKFNARLMQRMAIQ